MIELFNYYLLFTYDTIINSWLSITILLPVTFFLSIEEYLQSVLYTMNKCDCFYFDEDLSIDGTETIAYKIWYRVYRRTIEDLNFFLFVISSKFGGGMIDISTLNTNADRIDPFTPFAGVHSVQGPPIGNRWFNIRC